MDIFLTLVNAGCADVTNSGALNHIPDSESLDGLVLGYTSRAVAAAHKLDMATASLVAAAISSFSRLHNSEPMPSSLGKDCKGLHSTIVQST